MYNIGSIVSALAKAHESRLDGEEIIRQTKICPIPLSIGVGVPCPA